MAVPRYNDVRGDKRLDRVLEEGIKKFVPGKGESNKDAKKSLYKHLTKDGVKVKGELVDNPTVDDVMEHLEGHITVPRIRKLGSEDIERIAIRIAGSA